MYGFNIKTLLPFCLLLLASCSGSGDSDGFPRAAGVEELKGHTVGCIAGSLCDLGFDDLAPGAIKRIYNNTPDLLTAFDNYKTQFLMVDSILVVGIDRNRHPMEPAYSEPSVPGDVGVAFRKTDVELCNKFNEFLASIKADGTYAAMRDRWISDKLYVSDMPEIETYTAGKPLEVGSMVQVPCCFAKNGEWVGFEVEMMKRFAAYVQRPLAFETYDFSALMAGLKTGVIDIWCSFITINEERAREVLFSDPYFYSPITIFQKVDACG